MSEHAASPVGERKDRIRAEVAVQMLEGAKKRFDGVTRDVSVSGFSAFLRTVAEDSIRESIDYSVLAPEEMKQALAKMDLSVVLDMGFPIGPAALVVMRVENSWRKDFDMFAAFEFKSLNESEKVAISDYVAAQAEAQPPVPAQAEEGPAREGVGEPEVVNVNFPARYFYLAHVRELCERLSREAGFAEEDAMKIKVAFDEVLTNAFKHGCINYGVDKIDVNLTFDDAGVFVCVRDPAGRPFDYRKYREFDEKHPDSSRTGLHLVDRLMDGWAVNTKPGKFTEVSFFKNRASREG